jgi:hypothetical protein
MCSAGGGGGCRRVDRRVISPLRSDILSLGGISLSTFSGSTAFILPLFDDRCVPVLNTVSLSGGAITTYLVIILP